MSKILVFCPRELGITQQSIRHAMSKSGYTSIAEAAIDAAITIQKIAGFIPPDFEPTTSMQLPHGKNKDTAI